MRRRAYCELVPRWAEFGARFGWAGKGLSVPVGLWRTAHGIARWDRLAAVELIRDGLDVSRARASIIYARSEIATARSSLDFAALEARSPADMADWAQAHCEAENTDQLRSALEDGSPLVLLVTSFAPHYFGLITPELVRLAGRRVAILQPRQALEPLHEIGFYERLSAASGQPIDTIVADSPAALLQSIRALASGSIVALRIDSIPTQTGNFLLSRMFGRPAAFPASILHMGRSKGAVFLPLFVLRRKRGFATSFGAPVKLGPRPSNVELIDAATAIDGQIESRLKSNASSYSAWYSVYEKLRLAKELIEASDSNMAEP